MEHVAAFDTASAMALDGRRLLVPGAAHGFGFGIATAFIGAGCRVAMLDIEADRLASAAEEAANHGDAVGFPVDIRSDVDVQRIVEQAGAALGGIDAVLNVAGIYPV